MASKRMSISGTSGYGATSKDDLPSPPDPEFEFGSLTHAVRDMHTEQKKEISSKHLYEELQKYISEFTFESPRSKEVAAQLKIELYRAAFPHGALSKGSTIREPYAYGGQQFFELEEYLKSLAHTNNIELRTTAIRERVQLFKAAFPKGIYQERARSRNVLG